MHVTQDQIDAVKRQWGLLPRNEDVPYFKIRPISETWRALDRAPAYKTAVANVAYIWRDPSATDRFGSMPSSFRRRRSELWAAGLESPASAPRWTREPYRVWKEADAAAGKAGDPTEVAAWHVVMGLPPQLPSLRWKELVIGFVEREFIRQGAVVAWAIHAQAHLDRTFAIKPHVHLIVTARRWRHDGLHGQRHAAWAGHWGRQQGLDFAWRRACRGALLWVPVDEPAPRLGNSLSEAE